MQIEVIGSLLNNKMPQSKRTFYHNPYVNRMWSKLCGMNTKVGKAMVFIFWVEGRRHTGYYAQKNGLDFTIYEAGSNGGQLS